MKNKKILASILAVSMIGIAGVFEIVHFVHAKSTQSIKVMSYKPSAKVDETGYQIDKYENIESVVWINENQVLTLTRKGELKNPDSSITVRYCSIYNLSTKKSKDFKDVNMSEFLGVSKDKKYVLYVEPMKVPKIGIQEWKNKRDSGELNHRNIKLLNLSTGKITDLNTEKVNSDAQFIWVSNNKILANYSNHWSIIDTTGKLCADGSYNAGKYDKAHISGVDDIKDLGNSVEGKFYYTQDKNGQEGIKLCSMDVKTKEIKDIYYNKYSLSADKKGKTIIMDGFNNNGPAINGVYKNRIFEALIMNESGKVIQNIKLPKGRSGFASAFSNYILSPDGSKAVYVEINGDIDPASRDFDAAIKVIDTKSGNVEAILKDSILKDEGEKDKHHARIQIESNGSTKEKIIEKIPGISNICWDSTGTALFFTYGYSDDELIKNNINTYIVTFDK